ncbi:uncharacterized protein BX664DRAFT_258104 [Halteromyces radiatus]|uniref:uncharacterized protein n=1 Tax=Halteromyces radiatus TaxID=101107 RepID=UPI00221E7DE7|nr:uncharacterized protein BX664DRAFT_258104 [Halteromyces radiatus]KAI8096598.1 hypothetical protein BX664DRAFT_258104 [Halteromyces radiatus]
MTTSKTDINVNGLQLSVYGLTEYKKLPENTPVAVMFALHGRLQNKSKMEAISQVLCSLNASKGGKPRSRHLLVVTFDHVNHGSRLVDKKANFSWKEGKHQNPNHAIDMWSMFRSGARTVSELIDVLEYYLFDSGRPVQVWGCLGFSMGAHATFLAAANGKKMIFNGTDEFFFSNSFFFFFFFFIYM